MTSEQQATLQAAKFELLHYAVLYSIKAVENNPQQDVSAAEQSLLTAAKNWTRIVDSIDPKLWEPCEVWVDTLK